VPAPEIGLLSLGDGLDDAGVGRTTPAERQRAIVARAVLAERLGFDSVWLAGPVPGGAGPAAPAVVLAAIAARTERVRLGAGVTLLAPLDPLRVAEDYATLDGISGGRVELLAGCGAASDPLRRRTDESHERFRENVELLRRLWTEAELCWSGRFRAPLERVTVEPRPVQRPHPPLWIEAGTADAVALAAELGLPLLLPCLGSSLERFAPLVDRYRERAGAVARVAACHALKVVLPGRAVHEQGDATSASFHHFLGASPAALAERVRAARETLQLDVQLLAFELGGLPEPARRETLERFGAEALPLLRAS
jgi:alkanesulfonate monooxygenase SsuD/methylene tetrahydromethanopterin reductase-like flavin-dependent oxidoreductase (luciferase family)